MFKIKIQSTKYRQYLFLLVNCTGTNSEKRASASLNGLKSDSRSGVVQNDTVTSGEF